MRGVRVAEHGGPEVLEWVELDDPAPDPTDIVVETVAAGLNFVDVYQRSGLYSMVLPFTLGLEGAGVVTAVGDQVTGVAVGDRVAWGSVLGSYRSRSRCRRLRPSPCPQVSGSTSPPR